MKTVLGLFACAVFAADSVASSGMGMNAHRKNSKAIRVPAAISAFLARPNEISVTVFRFASRLDEPSSGAFHKEKILEAKQLDSKAAAEAVRVLRTSSTFTDSHLGCVGAAGTGFGMRLQRNEMQLDLQIDIVCDHVFDAESGEEIGQFSSDGKGRLRDLYLRAFRKP